MDIDDIQEVSRFYAAPSLPAIAPVQSKSSGSEILIGDSFAPVSSYSDEVDDIQDVGDCITGRFDEKPALPRPKSSKDAMTTLRNVKRMEAWEKAMETRFERLEKVERFGEEEDGEEDVVKEEARTAMTTYMHAKGTALDDMTEDAWEIAFLEKAKGNRLYQRRKYHASYQAYRRGADVFEERFEDVSELQGDARKLNALLCSNAAQSLLNCTDVEGASSIGARTMADKALLLDPTNLKALFRRGCAHSNTMDWSLACDDFEQLLRVEPTNEAARSELQRAAENMREERRSEKEQRAIDVATDAKSEGNRLFSEGQAHASYLAYKAGLDVLEDGEQFIYTEAARKLEVALCCNAANALLYCKGMDAAPTTGARAMADRALLLEPENVKALFRRACSYANAGDWELAQQGFEHVLRLDPTNNSAKVELQKVLETRANILETALPAAADEIDEVKSFATSRVDKKTRSSIAEKDDGNKFFASGQHRLASAAYQRGLDIFRGTPIFELDGTAQKLLISLYCNAAQAMLKCGDHEGAREMADEALKLDPANIKALFRRGCAHASTAAWELARIDFQEVLRLDPSNDAARTELGQLGPRADRAVEEAARARSLVSDEVLERTMNDVEYLKREADHSFNRRQHKAAAMKYESALSKLEPLGPQFPTPESREIKVLLLSKAAVSLLSCPGIEKATVIRARTMAEQALQMKPSCREALLGRGRACASVGETDLARADLEQVLRLDPADKVASSELQKVLAKMKDSRSGSGGG